MKKLFFMILFASFLFAMGVEGQVRVSSFKVAPVQWGSITGNLSDQSFSTGVLKGNSGTVGAPFYTFSASSNTGLYMPSTSQLGLVVGGVEAFRSTVISNASYKPLTCTYSFNGPNGDITSPSYTFTNDGNTGMYSSGSDSLAFGVGGAKRVEITTSAMTLDVYLEDGSGQWFGSSLLNTGDNADTVLVSGLSYALHGVVASFITSAPDTLYYCVVKTDTLIMRYAGSKVASTDETWCYMIFGR